VWFLALSLFGSIAIHCIPLPDGTVLVGHCGTFVVTLVLRATGVFCEGGVMCCKLSQLVYCIAVGFVHCCFSSLCALLLFIVLVSVDYVVIWDHCLVSLFQSVNNCYVFIVVGTRYSPRSLCRCWVVSFSMVYFLLFVSLAFICL